MGRIPRDEWPKILARYNSGETIASIGRAYRCSAAAIRYIVKRSGKLKDDAAGAELALPLASAAPLDAGPAGRAKGAQALGPELRQRVSGDIDSFLVALDQVVLDRSPQNLYNLEEATDQLMRSIARTRLALERLLSAHEGAEVEEDAGRAPVSGRQRDA